MAKPILQAGDDVTLRGVKLTVINSLPGDPPNTIRCEWYAAGKPQSGFFDADKVLLASTKSAPLIVKPPGRK